MSFKLPESIAESLLYRLGHDDSFRECFVQDPRDALASLGFEPAKNATIKHGIWNCLTVSELASKEAICGALDLLRIQLTKAATFNPISLGFSTRSGKVAA